MQPTAAVTEAPRLLRRPTPVVSRPAVPGGWPSSRRRSARPEPLGALYHPTNPFDAWFCRSCHVFGRGGGSCWCCGETPSSASGSPASAAAPRR